MGCQRPPSEGFCCAANRMRRRIASPGNVPRRQALPHRPCSRCLTDLLAEPQLLFSIPNQCLLMLALWSCGRRAGVVQAQRQIHRAFAGQKTRSRAPCSWPRSNDLQRRRLGPFDLTRCTAQRRWVELQVVCADLPLEGSGFEPSVPLTPDDIISALRSLLTPRRARDPRFAGHGLQTEISLVLGSVPAV